MSELSSALSGHLILAPHSAGSTIFPLHEFPLRVYVYRLRNRKLLHAEEFQGSEVILAAWCEIYRNREDAEEIAAMAEIP